MELSQDILEFIRLLNRNRVEYLVVGGWAVAVHGKPRYTKDVDILIRMEPENAKRMVLVLRDFGFGSLDITEDDFLTPGHIIQLGFEPNRIDLLTTIPAVNFDDAYKNKIVIELSSVQISFIGQADLVRNKEAAGREQDLLDVKFIKKRSGDT